MRRVAIVMTLAGCSGGAPAAAPGTTVTPTPSQSTQVSASDDAPSATATTVVEDSARLPYNCLPYLTAVEEISRFLTRAATHASRSDACADGQSTRVAIDALRVCPAAGGTPNRRPFDTSFRVTTYLADAGLHKDANTPPPHSSVQRVTFTFSPQNGGYVLDTNIVVPDLPDGATPATAAHDGECYGKSKAFVPQVIELP